MKKRFLLAFFGVCLYASCLMAQQKAVSGKVTSSDGGGLSNVTVIVKGTTRSVQTNADGSFSIQAAPGETLIFRAIGSGETSQLVGSGNVYNIKLSGSEEAIDEVVVTALGIKKEKKALGYAVQDIKADELMKNKTSNVVNSLAGKIAGVNVTQSSGAAGAGAQIILRGGTSLERDNQPLFVVDGVIYDNSTVLGGNSGFDGAQTTSSSNSNRIMDVNPEDIENVSVLKGPAAAALYGSRAAAGAIIITTKRGKEGRAEISFSSRASTNWVNRLPEQQNKYKRGSYNAKGVLDTYTTQSWGEEFGANDVMYDNIKDFFQTSSIYDNNVSLAGGSQNTTYYISASRFDQKGIVPSTGFDKTTFRFNGDQKYGRLKLGANIAYSLANTDKTLTSAGLYNSGGTGAMNSVYRWSRNDDMRKYLNDDGTKYRMFEGLQKLQDDVENPYWTVNRNVLGDKTERFTANINANLNLFDWWNVSYQVGTDSYLTRNSTLIAENGAVKEQFQKGMMSESDYKFNYWSSNLMSNFNKTVGDFDLGALVGFYSEQTTVDNNRRMGFNFVVDKFYSFENIIDANKRFSSIENKRRLFGLYGELKAAYKNMLFLNVTGRNDWTSTLPVANRSYFYPSVGGSFVFSELTKDVDWLSFGKVRASWAKVGKDATPYLTDTYLWPSKDFLGGLVGTGNHWNRGNPILKPESTTSFEIGAELRFFNNRLGVDYTYYTNNSYDQIISPRMGQSTGYILVSVNAGDIYNKGMELALTGKPIVKDGFVWESTLNMARNKGTLENLFKGAEVLYVTDVQVGNAKAASFNGGDFMAISGSKWTRTPDGKVVLDSKTGMPVSDNLTTYAIGNREPKLTGGFNNSFQYKNLNLSFLFDFRIGGDIYNGTDYAMTINGMSKRSMERESITLNGAINTGTASNPVYEDKSFTYVADQDYEISGVKTSGKKIIQDYYTTFYARESANFMTNTNWLRLRSISLSYDFRNELVKNAGLSKVVKGLTATVTGTNLWLLTNYKGMDPEASAAGSGIVGSSSVGIDFNGVPSTAGVAFGLNFKF
ncbi:SusC/RagA family TonB-linked outer membrane protein [Sphingobacterium tabacisoli]|uniref:SusC/RagA family TonB-linked outer membrane protein n=1 Tax=Sphingobacterium tabacisoli TaxID=2044855 RepID=A0ABW5KYP9_9SPHI|nr:SusC/RagA family TonB-linked outer membrane protein [Sphingobacterium tabacisoli]